MKCRPSKFEAIVCDIRLPDLSGEDLFREAARSSGVPPFVFITGYGDIDQAVRLMRAGAADYFMKPFEIDDFLVRLGELMGPGRVVRNTYSRTCSENKGTRTSANAGGEA